MKRSAAVVVGLGLGLVVAIPASAGSTIQAKEVRVFQQSGVEFTADVAYRCDPSSDAKWIDLVIHDGQTGANGHGEANYPTCDGAEHVLRIPGDTTDGGLFNRGDQATVRVWMRDSHVNPVPGADSTETITLH
ncbi:MAG TPA: hypothetical protein VKX24_09585 [Acidimicrobiia bacterium]|nr:hypothetical protein [Acidimicrobiia bacterium]HZQ77760.1 hypothetical protein [Acidimicrobiia bacterium]